MLVDEEILKDILQQKVALIKRDLPSTAFNSIVEWANIHYKMKHGIVVETLNGYKPIDTLSYEELYKLMTSIKYGLDKWSTQIDLGDLREDTYFTKTEKDLYQEPVKYENLDKDLVFDEFVEVVPNQKYSVKMTLKQHGDIRKIGRARYNPETQRDLIEVVSNGIKYDKIDINTKSVENIKDLIISGDFECDDLTFNINTDINTDISMLPRVVGNKLIIPKEAIMDVLDGWHRSQAFYLTYLTNPDVEFTFGVKIVIWNTAKATQFILLQDKKNHLKQTQTKRIDKNDAANFIIDQLKMDNNFYLRSNLNKQSQYDLNIIINDIFAPVKSKIKDNIDLSKLISEKMNELTYEKNMFDRQLSKEEWYVYLYILKNTSNSGEFMKVINSIADMDEVLQKVKYVKKPSVNSHKYLDKLIKEVNGNVV